MEIIASLPSARLEPALSSTAVAAAPDAAAVQRFEALKQAAAPDVASAAAPTTALQAAAINPQNLGEAMLNGIQKVSQNFRDISTRVNETLRSDIGMDSAKWMNLHMDLSMASINIQVVAKATSSVQKSIDQLTHLQ